MHNNKNFSAFNNRKNNPSILKHFLTNASLTATRYREILEKVYSKTNTLYQSLWYPCGLRYSNRYPGIWVRTF